MMVVTKNNLRPYIENVKKEKITNIRHLSLTNDSITELTRLLILRADNSKTQFMTVLLFGCKGYFKIHGVLKNAENFWNGFVSKPNRTSHPRLTAKVQKIYNIWYGLKKAKCEQIQNKNKLSKPEDVSKEKDDKIENDKKETDHIELSSSDDDDDDDDEESDPQSENSPTSSKIAPETRVMKVRNVDF